MPTTKEITFYTKAEVQEHNSDNSLWVIIANKVYDLTKFLNEHPGGIDILIQNAGTDATNNFEDAGHSNDARGMMKEYEIGELNEAERKEVKVSTERPGLEGSCADHWEWYNLNQGYWYQGLIPAAGMLAAAAFMYLFLFRAK